jgi:cytochrome oxidase Cu insertion factor (SCO1/SenC/PrrC family)
MRYQSGDDMRNRQVKQKRTVRVAITKLRLVVFLLAGFFVSGIAALPFIKGSNAIQAVATPTEAGPVLIGGPFTLTDHNGRRVTDQNFRGKFMLVFFGFSYCPDACPTGLQVIAGALDELGPQAEHITPVLITIDPERDTPAQLAAYVKSFHPRLIGLTGSQAEIDGVVKEYRVYVKKVPDPKSTAGYTFDHSAVIYLMGPDGRYRSHFTPQTNIQVLAYQLGRML